MFHLGITIDDNMYVLKLSFHIAHKKLLSFERSLTMKSSTLVSVLIFHCVWSYQKLRTDSLVSNAISEILFEHFAKQAWKVDLIHYGEKSVKSEIVIDKVMRTKSASIIFQLSSGGSINTWKTKLNISTILLFDSVETFKRIGRNISWHTHGTGEYRRTIRYQHLVYVPNATVSDIVDTIKNTLASDVVGFLMNESTKSIDLMSLFMFTQRQCNKNQLITINRFNTSMKWENSSFFPQKYRNLRGCPLKVAMAWLPGMKIQIPHRIILDFAESANFSIDRVDLNNDIHTDESLTIFAAERECDRIFEMSHPYDVNKVVLFIPPGQLHTPLEKMFLMFQLEFWIAIAVTLMIAIAAIQVINLTSAKIQNFVFGRANRTPTMNLVSIFLNGSQFKVPGRNFARFLLMLFIFWSLIIRTCYQSELFKKLQTDSRKPVVETIDELFEENVSLFNSPIVQLTFKRTLKKLPTM